MIVTRGKLTVAQASRPVLTAECVECGESTVLLPSTPHASIDHRCPAGLAGAVWTLLERPAGADPAACRQPDSCPVHAPTGGVLTAEQARAAIALEGRARQAALERAAA